MYNCAEFIPDLFDMFSNQSFKNFEIIAVIDGATDETEDRVRQFREKDSRFTYVVRENGGAGAARNTGMDAALGKYIIFSDADDLYSKDYLLKLYEAAERLSAEITVCLNRTIDFRTGEPRTIRSFDEAALAEGRIYSSKNAGYPLRLITKAGCPFRMIDVHISDKLFLLDFVKAAGLRFSETPASNDLFFSKAALAVSDRVAVIHDSLLTIRRYLNPQSVSSNRGNYSHYALAELQKLYNWLDKQLLLKKLQHDYLAFFDATVNYEIKNGINPLFAEELVRILKCERPWSGMSAFQISRALKRSMGEKGREACKKVPAGASSDEIKRAASANEIIDKRNESRACMQTMIKSIAREKYGLRI